MFNINVANINMKLLISTCGSLYSITVHTVAFLCYLFGAFTVFM